MKLLHLIKNFLAVFGLLILFSGCSVKSELRDLDINYKPISERDLHTLFAIKYIEYLNRENIGVVNVKISCLYEYFDNCLEVWDSSFYYKNGLDYSKCINLGLQILNVPGLGKISFINSKRIADYKFSPFIVDLTKSTYHGQVLHKDGTTFSFGIKHLVNEFYITYVSKYEKGCIE